MHRIASAGATLRALLAGFTLLLAIAFVPAPATAQQIPPLAKSIVC